MSKAAQRKQARINRTVWGTFTGALKSIFAAAGNTAEIIENITEAGAVASGHLIDMADQFSAENAVLMEAKKEVMEKQLAEGTFNPATIAEEALKHVNFKSTPINNDESKQPKQQG